MGIGRRVGAFLGLVPEDQLADGQEFDHEFAGEPADHHDRPQHDRAQYEARPGNFQPEFAVPDYGRSVRPLDDRAGRNNRFAGAGAGAGAGDREPVVHGALAVKPEPVMRRDTAEVPATRPAAVKLTGFAEARIIGEKYRDGQSVILDMTDMSDSDARRLVDFSAGLAFSLRGSIEKVAPKVFMLLPPDTDVASPAAEDLLRDARAYAGR